jgi:hypothetical protein
MHQMATNGTTPRKSSSGDFAKQADEAQRGFVAEFVDYLKNNKKWWLTPIVIVLLMVGALIVLGGTAAAPFIYTLF